MAAPASMVSEQAHIRSVPLPVRALLDRVGPQVYFSWQSGHMLCTQSWEQYMPAAHKSFAADFTTPSLPGLPGAPAAASSCEAAGCGHEEDDDDEGEERCLRKASLGTVTSSTTAGSDTEEAVGGGSPSSQFDSILAHVWPLSQDPRGCRAVQEELERATCEQARVALAMQLRGHVAKASRCPHANYVLQKCIMVLQPAHCQFIIDELLQRENFVAQMVRHRYGCRIVQELLKRCSSEQLRGITAVLLADPLVYACHSFGNYVMQQFIEHGTVVQKRILAHTIEQHCSIVCQTSPGCSVVAALLAHGLPEDRQAMVRAIVQVPGLLPSVALFRAGPLLVRLLLQAASPNELSAGLQVLVAHLPMLRTSKYGLQVADLVELHSGLH